MRQLFVRLFLGVLAAVALSHALATVLIHVQFGLVQERLARAELEERASEIVAQLEVVDPAERAELLHELEAEYGVALHYAPPGEGPPPPAGRRPLPPRLRDGKAPRPPRFDGDRPPRFDGDRPRWEGKAPPPDGKLPPRGDAPRRPSHYPLSDGSQLIIGAPPPPPPVPWNMPTFLAQLAGVLVIVALVGWLLAAPVIRDLQQLEVAVERLGRDDLEARAEVGVTSPVHSLSTGFNTMADRIRHLVTGQRQLFQAVSHELRTPNARIRFLLEAVRDAETSEERDRLVQSIDDDLTEVDLLLDELLTYLRLDVDSPAHEMAPFPVGPPLEDLVDRIGPLHPGVVLSLDLGAGPLVAMGHRRGFTRAIENLLTNAMRHAGTKVAVSASRQGDQIIVAVDDDGMGVPEIDRERIFEPFVSGDASRSKNLGGVGLGLAIVRRVLERHGGSVRVTDSALRGAHFETRWPAG